MTVINETIQAFQNIPSDPALLLDWVTFPIAIMVSILLLALAFCSFKFIKFALAVAAAVAAGVYGSALLDPTLQKFAPIVSKSVVLSALVGIALALVAALIVAKMFRFAMFLAGGATGALVGIYVVVPLLAPVNEFFATLPGTITVAAVLATAGSILFVLFFKHVFIFLSTVVFCTAAGALIGLTATPELNVPVVASCAAVGLIVGLIAMRFQYSQNRRRYLI